MGLCDVDKEGLRMMEDLAKPYAVIIGHFSDLKLILYCCKPTFIGVPEILTSLVIVNISHCKPVLDIWLPFVVKISRRKSVYL